MQIKISDIKKHFWKMCLTAAFCTAAGAIFLCDTALKADAAEYVMNEPENLSAHGVEVDMNSAEDFYLVSNELPSSSATSVTFQFTIDSFVRTGTRAPWIRAGAVNGTLKTLADEQFRLETANLYNGLIVLPQSFTD